MEGKPNVRSSLVEKLKKAPKPGSPQIRFDPQKCKGTWQCYEVCPVGCWTPDRARRVVVFHDSELCINCGACVLQCPEDAIELR